MAHLVHILVLVSLILQALSVADAKEAWLFHILPDDTGTSAIWATQRVPDEHVTIVSNIFRIRKIKKDSPDFMYSSNLWDIAQKHELWTEKDGVYIWRRGIRIDDDDNDDGGHHGSHLEMRHMDIAFLLYTGDLDFLAVYGYPQAHPTALYRRIWRVYQAST